MHPLIIYCSRTGNTQKVALAMAGPLDADCLPVEEITRDHLAQRNLIGLGSGIYWVWPDAKIIDLAHKIPASCKVFLFTTSGLRFEYMVTIYKRWRADILRARGVTIVGQWHCPGFDQHPVSKWMGIGKDRPNEEDLASARDFASALKL